ncbi:lef8 [Lambdina fiscellaria nucleopolyhedrovirus]|uniref:Lef8 n=2 Tax=Alphabaculovirus TaxID=558016 RepID=A0A0E3Z633_9ABAC|nr:lef8 [Lambdina fiscellaria nucleopolyhedrovirus]AKC91723.1 lef8 [Lambdina fiscellaria nucleopolyhedrovirus]
MTDVVKDFDRLYAVFQQNYGLSFYLDCSNKETTQHSTSNANCCEVNDATTTTIRLLQERKSYLCCATDDTGRCVLHKCVPVIIGTALDKRFRAHDTNDGKDVTGTFIIDGRHLSFPNIMMNNNILIHNFYDKLYSKNCKRMFLYGNVDEEKNINRAIQLVYDKHEDVLFARDVYARDYVVTENLNTILDVYLRRSGKWEPLNFLFDFEPFQSQRLVEQIKRIMRIDINYSIDSLANKIIYKHDYLLSLIFAPILKMHKIAKNVKKKCKTSSANLSTSTTTATALTTTTTNKNSTTAISEQTTTKTTLNTPVPSTATTRVKTLSSSSSSCLFAAPIAKKRKMQSIMYPRESKKIVETIVNGKLIYAVSKTFSKQRKNFINYQDNSSNNNIEINPPLLKYRVGNEVVRITNDTMRQDMLMQKSDFVKFVDSFFHGEMTVAGKKFFLCRNVRLCAVDYDAVALAFKNLLKHGLMRRVTVDDMDAVCNNTNAQINNDHNDKNVSFDTLSVAFNDRPTVFCCRRADLQRIFYHLKRGECSVELKLADNTLFVNHHEGMTCIKRMVLIDNDDIKVRIATLLTPFEYHNANSLLRMANDVGVVDENDDVTCLMSKLVQYYYKNYTRIFSTIPVPKLIVSLTNLKNAMPVLAYRDFDRDADDRNYNTFLDELPPGNSVTVSPQVRINNKMFKLWTLVRDSRLMTAEDPYIPDTKLPVQMYNNKINKLKGKLMYVKNETPVLKFIENKESVDTVNIDNSNDNNDNRFFRRDVRLGHDFNDFSPCVLVDGGNVLYLAGAVVSNVKIGWVYDGKRYKIETCKNKNHFVSKVYIYFRQNKNQRVERLECSMNVCGDTVYLKLSIITSTNDLQGVKICGIHGQKGVMNGTEDLTEWQAEDGTSAQICLSPVSYLSRQSNFDDVEKKYVVRGGDHSDAAALRYPIYNIPYMLFNNTPDNIFKEFIKSNHTGHEKVEGTRLDQWTINQSFAGNRWAESLQCVRGSSNVADNSGEFNVMNSLLHCNNIIMK